MIIASLFNGHRVLLGLGFVLLASGCTQRLSDNAFKADSGCKVKQYNIEWAAKNIDSIDWDGPCVNREANGYGKLTVTMRSKQVETYEGRMRDGKFDTTLQRPDEKSVYVMGNKRLAGEFRAGRFLSGQIFVDDKIDFDGILYQPSRRYASGKSYFPDGSYIEGSFYDKEGNVSTTGPGVYQGIVYNDKQVAVGWIFQEKLYDSSERWSKEIAEQKQQQEARAKRAAEINTGVSKLLAQFDRMVLTKAETPEDQRLQVLQRRDAAQARAAVIDKLLWQCRTAGCEGLEYLRNARETELRQVAATKELASKLPPAAPAAKPAATTAAADKPGAAKAATPKPVVPTPLTLAKLQVSEDYTKAWADARSALKLK